MLCRYCTRTWFTGNQPPAAMLSPEEVDPRLRSLLWLTQELVRLGSKPEKAVIEILDSAAYVEQIQIRLAPEQYLQLRAANRTRPLIRLLDWQTDRPDALTVRMSAGSRFVLDGILVSGRGVSVVGGEDVPISSLPYRDVGHIRNCIDELKGSKEAKTVNRVHSHLFFYRTVKAVKWSINNFNCFSFSKGNCYIRIFLYR